MLTILIILGLISIAKIIAEIIQIRECPDDKTLRRVVLG